MRVYEFSKKHEIAIKDLLDALNKGGFDIHSHMSVLPQDAIDLLNKQFKLGHSPAKVENSVPSKQSVAASSTVSILRENSQVSEAPKVVHKTTGASDNTEGVARGSVVPEKKESDKHEPLTIESMMVGAFADKIKKPVSEIIVVLLKWGIVAAKNQQLTEDVIARLATHFEIPTIQKSREVASVEKEVNRETLVATQAGSSAVTGRPPIVVVLGHVDHGKTTLLDFIRKTRVASREKGGITQHLGAYEASTPHGNVVFIDTPGHEAFSKMRMRGIKVADVVILVVAADDSVMPQTVEAIKQAKSMNVPIIVAVNKMDRVDKARLEVVKRDLSTHGVISEEWGGDVVLVPISAKTGQGVDQLLDMIILQSQMMELKSSDSGYAKGYVLEAKLEKGRGPVATLLCQRGLLQIGDYFVCGSTSGKVTSLTNSRGVRVSSVKPAIPVLVAGFDELPNAGDYFEVVSQSDYKRRSRNETTMVSEQRTLSQATLKSSAKSSARALNILLKTDTNSSKEAVIESLHKLSKKFENKFNIVFAGVGTVAESDIEFAATTKSVIYTLHVKAEPNAVILAQKLGVSINYFDIIYKLLEKLEAVAEGAKEVKKVRTKIGEATVRQVFNIKGIGVIAGSYVNDGKFSKDGTVVILRGRKKVGEGPIKSLQRDKKSVKEVHSGYECGFLVEGFNEWEVDDKVECYLEVAEQQPKK